MRVKIGAEDLDSLKKTLQGRVIGLVTNHSAFSSELGYTLELARSIAQVEVVFTPEHGLWGSAAAGELVHSHFDDEYNLRVYSLYGDVLEPPTEEIRKLDAVVYDIQDVGLRWYTYITTLYYVEKACAKAGTPLVVLDRPNPLTGAVTEGPVLKAEYRSFCGTASLPARYGLTPGELALYYSKVEGLGCDVEVVKLEGWSRNTWYDETGLPWVPPSPNIPTLETALVYAGACLLEGTNLSEGRGTASPFLQFGAPWIKARELAKGLNSLRMPGAVFRPVKFVPAASKYKGVEVRGVYVHVTDRSLFKPFTSFVKILAKIREMHSDKFVLLTREAEREVEYLKDYTNLGSTKASRYAIDYLAGDPDVRKCIEGTADVELLEEKWKKERENFVEKAEEKGILLYPGVLKP